ncbi:MAG: 50S ribosomal protein L35 [Candidatus Fermentibacteraceae bacterium]|nr:50S ribosomal protein L35 [Candidatus Fermentibacteraceae bacterium]MBN2609660.1 50S ribosomal protein L35 [Candidatus Fermentibacteraceae bacterium]
MPKMKTHKGAARRFRKTAKGKFKMNRPLAQHIKTKKSPKRLRKLRKASIASHADARKLKKLLP